MVDEGLEQKLCNLQRQQSCSVQGSNPAQAIKIQINSLNKKYLIINANAIGLWYGATYVVAREMGYETLYV